MCQMKIHFHDFQGYLVATLAARAARNSSGAFPIGKNCNVANSKVILKTACGERKVTYPIKQKGTLKYRGGKTATNGILDPPRSTLSVPTRNTLRKPYASLEKRCRNPCETETPVHLLQIGRIGYKLWWRRAWTGFAWKRALWKPKYNSVWAPSQNFSNCTRVDQPSEKFFSSVLKSFSFSHPNKENDLYLAKVI